MKLSKASKIEKWLNNPKVKKWIENPKVQKCAVVLLIICLASGAHKLYLANLDSRIDYKTLDAHGIPREWIEDPFLTCIGTHDKDLIVKKFCTCNINGIIHSLTKEEFIKFNNGVLLKKFDYPEIDKKVKDSEAECHSRYIGN